VIEDLVHLGQAAVSAMVFQGWPSQVMDHSGGTAVIISVACDIAGTVALDLFKLVGVAAGVRVPDSGSILHSRPDCGSIQLCHRQTVLQWRILHSQVDH